MPVPTYTVTCLRHRMIAKDVYELAFEKPAGLSFKAGQFVLWDVPLVETPADIQPRAYSIASSPHEQELLFVIKWKEGGRTSRWMAEVAKPGTTMVMKGPFGVFTLKPEQDGDYLFIGTGTGVAPLRAHILEAIERGDTRRMDLIFGVRTEEDLFWLDELRSLTQAHDNVFVHLALSQPTDAWTGHRGRVQTLAPLIAPDMAQKRIYICGNPDMTTELKKLCLETWGVPKERLHVEGYI